MDEEFFYDKLKRLGLQDKTLNGLVDLIDDQKKEIERLKAEMQGRGLIGGQRWGIDACGSRRTEPK